MTLARGAPANQAACGQPLPARDRDWDCVRDKLPPCARDGTGRTVAVFAWAGSGLFEAIALPCPLPERGALGPGRRRRRPRGR
jgi:hypothetical protein